MAGLNHDFLLLRRTEHDYWDYSNFHNRPEAVLIHDDLLHYLGDSLRWIPCHDPTRRRGVLLPHNGLNFYGPTVITKDGASMIHRIFDAWSILFANGPNEVVLTGAWGWIEGEPAENGRYSTIVANKDELVTTLRQIAQYGRQVEEDPDDLYILHMGI
jgi:hypothetical protein